MGDVVRLRPDEARRRRREKLRERAKGDTLCRRGFHRWRVDTTTRFDVERGRLVTVRRCERCGATRQELA